MKNKYFIIIVFVLSIICLCLFGNLYFNELKINSDNYNENLKQFSIDLVKGNKTIEDINNSNFDINIKEDLLSFYNQTFYNEEDLILVYEDIDFFYEKVEQIRNIQLTYGDEIKDKDCSYYYNYGIVGVNASEEEIKLSNLYCSYLYYNEDIDSVIPIVEEQGNLYVKAKDLEFGSLDTLTTYYKGIELNINKYLLNKVLISERKFNQNYSTFNVFDTFEEDGYIYYQYKNTVNEFNVLVNLKTEQKFGKINSIEIIVK